MIRIEWHVPPSDLDDVPAVEIMEIAKFYELREQDRINEHARTTVDNIVREAQNDADAGPPILGRPRVAK